MVYQLHQVSEETINTCDQLLTSALQINLMVLNRG